MNPQGLATTRRMKTGGRAAVVPLGEVNNTINDESRNTKEHKGNLEYHRGPGPDQGRP